MINAFFGSGGVLSNPVNQPTIDKSGTITLPVSATCYGIHNEVGSCWLNAAIHLISMINEADNVIFNINFFANNVDKYATLTELKKLSNEYCTMRKKDHIKGGNPADFIGPAIKKINESYQNLISEDYNDYLNDKFLKYIFINDYNYYLIRQKYVPLCIICITETHAFVIKYCIENGNYKIIDNDNVIDIDIKEIYALLHRDISIINGKYIEKINCLCMNFDNKQLFNTTIIDQMNKNYNLDEIKNIIKNYDNNYNDDFSKFNDLIIDFSNNNITSLNNLSLRNPLATLKFANSQITKIENCDFDVYSIDFSDNNISTIDNVKFNGYNVNLENNNIAIYQITNEQNLNLSNNKIRSIDHILNNWNNPELKKIILNHNDITVFTDVNYNTYTPISLALVNCNISVVNCKSRFGALIIDLSANKIKEIERITFDHFCKKLILDNNAIETIASIKKFRNITDVSLEFNNIIEPSIIDYGNYLPGIEILNLSNNVNFGDTIGNVTFPESLEELTLRNCNISSIYKLSLSNGIKLLDLSRNNIPNINNNSFPDTIETLFLMSCNLKSISFTPPKNLKVLVLSNNSISRVKWDIFNNIPLENLYLDNNQITELQKCNIKVSYTLSLKNNNIKYINNCDITCSEIFLENNLIYYIANTTLSDCNIVDLTNNMFMSLNYIKLDHNIIHVDSSLIINPRFGKTVILDDIEKCMKNIQKYKIISNLTLKSVLNETVSFIENNKDFLVKYDNLSEHLKPFKFIDDVKELFANKKPYFVKNEDYFNNNFNADTLLSIFV